MELYSPQSYLDRAQRLLEQGQITDAFRYAEKAWQLDPKFAPALLEMGKILEQNGQFDDSLNYYEEALSIDPKLWEARWRIGIIYDRKGLTELAFQSWQNVMISVPELFPSAELLKLAKALIQHQNPQGAIGILQSCMHLPEAHQLQSQAHILLEEIDAAAVSLIRVQEIDPSWNVAVEYTSLGRLALKHEQTDRAQTFLQTALAIQPDLIEAHFYLALSFATIGKFKEAFLCFQELVSIDSNYAPAYYEMGILAAQLSKQEEAEAFFMAGRTLDPNIYPQVQPLIDRLVSRKLPNQTIGE